MHYYIVVNAVACYHFRFHTVSLSFHFATTTAIQKQKTFLTTNVAQQQVVTILSPGMSRLEPQTQSRKSKAIYHQAI